jgi:hypothetical protein
MNVMSFGELTIKIYEIHFYEIVTKVESDM